MRAPNKAVERPKPWRLPGFSYKDSLSSHRDLLPDWIERSQKSGDGVNKKV
jgi:hypothetical protein